MGQMRVKDWQRFQHYSNRRPPWIKFYTEIIEEFKEDGTPNDLFALSDSAKLTLLLAWLLASHFGGNLPDRPAHWYARRLGIRSVNLDEPIAAGFLEVQPSDSQDDTECASECASKDASANAQPCLRQSKRERQSKSTDSRPRSARRRVSYSEDFEAFWQVYPRPVNKGSAWKAWQQIAEPVPTLDDLSLAITTASASRQWQEEGGRFIPHPSTWLNARGWESRISPARPPQAPPSRTEQLAAEAIAHEREEGFRGYERAVLDGKIEPGNWPAYRQQMQGGVQ